MNKIFIIKDKFEIKDKSIIALTGVTHDDSLAITPGEPVIIKQKNLPNIEAKAISFELLRNCWSPHKPRNMALAIDLSIGVDNIELESEVWCYV